jgi:hypothetical protein
MANRAKQECHTFEEGVAFLFCLFCLSVTKLETRMVYFSFRAVFAQAMAPSGLGALRWIESQAVRRASLPLPSTSWGVVPAAADMTGTEVVSFHILLQEFQERDDVGLVLVG